MLVLAYGQARARELVGASAASARNLLQTRARVDPGAAAAAHQIRAALFPVRRSGRTAERGAGCALGRVAGRATRGTRLVELLHVRVRTGGGRGACRGRLVLARIGGVRLNVLLEVVRAHELLVAYLAGELLLTCVDAHMAMQLVRAGELFAAT